MRVNAIAYLRTQGMWHGNVWRPYNLKGRFRISFWRSLLNSYKSNRIKNVLHLV